ncbi:MAG: hypothetical protein U1F76_31250 [Candidatus Competibacteraceae bacterium]
MTQFYLLTAAIFGIAGIVIGFVFLRPVNEQIGFGVIRTKTFRPAGTYTQHHPGAERSFRTPTQIPIAAAYVFEIVLDERHEPVTYSLNTTASERFSVGQRVRLRVVFRKCC